MTSVEEYEQQPIDHAGIVRAWPTSWTIESYDSGAIALAIRFACASEWSAEHRAWSDPWPTGWFVEGRVWLVKKASTPGGVGELNAKSAKSLQEAGLWNGDWDEFADAPPAVFVHVTVEEETYEGKVRYRGAWINPDAPEPRQRGSFTPTSPELIHTLRQRFGPATRAIMGGKPAGAPGAPPARAGAPAAAAATSGAPQHPGAAQAQQAGPGGHPGARPAAAHPGAAQGHPAGAPQHRPAAHPGAGPARPAGGPPAGAQGGPRPPAASNWPATTPHRPQAGAQPAHEQHGDAYEGADPVTDEQPPF